MEAVTIGDWGVFFSAQLGAAATLGGLVFVGLSLNLKTILSYPALPSRALLALFGLLAILIVSSFALIPGQSLLPLGIEIFAIGLAVTTICTGMEINTLRRGQFQDRPRFIINLILIELGLVPFVIGGIMMLFGEVKGLYWVAAGVIISFVKAMLDAWVLLVEINR
jgi:hypothetical protein